MNDQTRQFVRDLLQTHRGDAEAVARYMRDSLRIGGIKACRAIVAEAVAQ